MIDRLWNGFSVKCILFFLSVVVQYPQPPQCRRAASFFAWVTQATHSQKFDRCALSDHTKNVVKGCIIWSIESGCLIKSLSSLAAFLLLMRHQEPNQTQSSMREFSGVWPAIQTWRRLCAVGARFRFKRRGHAGKRDLGILRYER